MRVYDITLERRDVFIFQQHGSKWVTVSHPIQYPKCVVGIWDAKTNTFGRSTDYPIRIAVPTFRVLKEDLDQFYKIHVIESIKQLDLDFYKRCNVIIPQKEVEDGYIETGYFFKDGEGDSIRTSIDTIVNRFLSLKSFW